MKTKTFDALEVLEIEDEIRCRQDVVRDAARRIRHCLECDQGYIIRNVDRDGRTYQCAEPCDCLRDYKRSGKDLWHKLLEYHGLTGRDYPDAITADMTWYAKPIGERVSLERLAYWRRRLESLLGGFGDIPEVE